MLAQLLSYAGDICTSPLPPTTRTRDSEILRKNELKRRPNLKEE